MRIVIDARSITEAQPTGVGVYAFHIIEALLQAAPEHDWVLFSSGQSTANAPLIEYLRTRYTVEHRHLAWPNKRFHAQAAVLDSPKIDEVAGGADVVFAPNVHVLPVSNDVPVVLTVHDVSYAMYPQYLSLRRALWHKVVRPQRLIEQAAHVVAVSQTTQTDVERVYSVKANAISTVYSGIPKILPTEHQPANIDHPLPEKYILMLSTVEPRKNIAGALQAYREYKDIEGKSALPLVVVGSPGWKSAHLIQEMITEPNVHYVGYVNATTQQAILEQASMLFYPSIYEGFGFPPLEALAKNVPVIASQAGALPEILGNAALYVDPYVTTDMARALSVMQHDNAMRERLATDAAKQLQRYSWQEAAEHMLEIFAKVAK